jgi:hypothetical protein
MSVLVELMPAALGPSTSELVETHADQTVADESVGYRYEVLPSGALVVWRWFEDHDPIAECTYSPAAWRSVRGAYAGPPHV